MMNLEKNIFAEVFCGLLNDGKIMIIEVNNNSREIVNLKK